MKHHAKILFLILIMLIGAGCDNDSSKPKQATTEIKTIRKTINTISGNMAATPAEAITVADDFCVSEFGAGYKAVLSGSARNATTDWVFAPNTEYFRADETTAIGTTNGSGAFTFPLEASVDDANTKVWTGLNADWTTATENCDDWTVGASGQHGMSNLATSGSFSFTDYQCTLDYYLYCVKQ